VGRPIRLLLIAAALTGVAAVEAGVEDGLSAYKAGRYREALTAFREEAERRPASADAAANVAATLERLGRHDEAVRECERALALGPSPRVEAAVRYNLGTALLALDRVDEAIEQLKASLRLEPLDREAKINLEIALRRRKEQPPGASDSSGGAPTPDRAPPTQSSTGASGPIPSVPRMTREEAERLLDAIERRERLEMPRSQGSSDPSDPSRPDW
jgi:tetratricopeptide (TPR) repeat protein